MRRKTNTPRRRKKTQKNSITSKISELKSLPLITFFTVLGILFVLIRMKGIEQDYLYNEVMGQIKSEVSDNKELKAKRASLLSVKKLQYFSKKYKLTEPDENHIIVIPE